MPYPLRIADNLAMDETESQSLFEYAVYLAHKTFVDPSDEHVLGIYSRLLWNNQRGLADDGAATIH